MHCFCLLSCYVVSYLHGIVVIGISQVEVRSICEPVDSMCTWLTILDLASYSTRGRRWRRGMRMRRRRGREKRVLLMAMKKEKKSKEVQRRRGSLVLPKIYDKGHLIKRDHSDSPMKSRKRKPRGAMIDCICKRRLGRRQRWSQRLKFVYRCCIPLLQEVLSNFVGLPF